MTARETQSIQVDRPNTSKRLRYANDYHESAAAIYLRTMAEWHTQMWLGGLKEYGLVLIVSASFISGQPGRHSVGVLFDVWHNMQFFDSKCHFLLPVGVASACA